MTYYPKSQVKTNLYTKGGEFQLKSTKQKYSGYYWKNSKGEIFIQKTKVGFSELIPKLLAIAKNRTDTRIYVRGDKNIDYGRVMEVMGKLSGSGFSKVALISETKR